MIRIDAPALSVSDLKADEAYIELGWDAPPVGTTGFNLVRYDPDGSATTLLETDDTSVRVFRDTPATGLAGSIRYEYVLETVIRGAAFQSGRVPAGLLTQSGGGRIEQAVRTILLTVNEVNSSGVLAVAEDRLAFTLFRPTPGFGERTSPKTSEFGI